MLLGQIIIELFVGMVAVLVCAVVIGGAVGLIGKLYLEFGRKVWFILPILAVFYLTGHFICQ